MYKLVTTGHAVETPNPYRSRCWNCVYLIILIGLQVGSLVVALSGISGTWNWASAPTPPGPEVEAGHVQGHGNYCLVDGTYHFLGRDLVPRGVRGYRGLERWCRNRHGTVGWTP